VKIAAPSPPSVRPADGVVRAEGLGKVYRGFGRRAGVEALSGLSLEVRRGEVLGLVGPNGSGKSTSLKLWLGLLRPTHGGGELLGRPFGDVRALARVGFLPEESYFYPFLTAAESLRFFARIFRIPAGEQRVRIRRLLEEVGLAEAADRPMRGYSKGMARRAGLAQAMLNDPELLLLDEPTSGLDPVASREVKDHILRWKGEGRTVVVCSHILSDMEDLCDRVAILARGRLVCCAAVDELLTDRDLHQVLIRGLTQEHRQALELWLTERGARLVSVRPERESLEGVFLRLVG
jgi:ABC-2 type transport system ATP-binding protein